MQVNIQNLLGAGQQKAVIVICSTPDSRRIPQKCFKVINGVTALEHILNRVKDCGLEVILAVPNNLSADLHDRYVAIKDKYSNVTLSVGSPDSPLMRTYEALIAWQYRRRADFFPKYIIRITHDDILIDCQTMLEMLEIADRKDADYAHTAGIVDGAGVEIIRAETIHKKAVELEYPVEHLSYFVKGQKQYVHEPRASIKRSYRLTMDYPQDVVVLENVLRAVGNNATIDSVCSYLDSHRQTLQYNRTPDLTIYSCCYNAEAYIAETIRSVMYAVNESNYLIEYFIIDDKSTDRSLEIILGQVGLLDNGNIKIIINEQNVGLASSSNVALAQARGKYIMRIDADDSIDPFELDKAIAEISQKDWIILYPSYNLMDEQGHVYGSESGDKHHAGGALMNKRAINELKFKEGLKHWDSLELYTRLMKYPELVVGHTDIKLFNYRQHAKSLSKNNTAERQAVLEEIKNGK